jgi:hypothetical protein
MWLGTGRGRLSDAPMAIGALSSSSRYQSMDYELFGRRGQVSAQELVRKARLLVGKHLLATYRPHSQSSPRYKDCGVKPVIFRAIWSSHGKEGDAVRIAKLVS